MAEKQKDNITEKLKELREKRKDKIKEIQQMVKKQKRILDLIRSELKTGPKTPVEISSSIGVPSHVVMWYLASMKKYSEVIEGEQKGSYFTYA